jgi:hypothetical protein
VAVHIDIMDGASADFATTGTRIVRVAKVTGVTGDGDERLYNAVTATGMPTLGDVHPSISGCYLRRMIPKPEANDVIAVRLIYESSSYQPNTINIAGTLSQTQTNIDQNGYAIQLGYTYPTDHHYEAWQDVKKWQSGYANFLKPGTNITVTKTMAFIPWQHITNYTGTVNGFPFKIGNTRIHGTRKWLCTGITAASNDAGGTYSVTYNLQYNPDTWDAVMVYQDPHDGRPPSDVWDTANQPDAVNTYQLYTSKNFNSLRL